MFTEYAGLLQHITETSTENSGAEDRQARLGQDTEDPQPKVEVDVPMLRSLPRRTSAGHATNEMFDSFSLGAELGFDAWLGIALQDAQSTQGSVSSDPSNLQADVNMLR